MAVCHTSLQRVAVLLFDKLHGGLDSVELVKERRVVCAVYLCLDAVALRVFAGPVPFVVSGRLQLLQLAGSPRRVCAPVPYGVCLSGFGFEPPGRLDAPLARCKFRSSPPLSYVLNALAGSWSCTPASARTTLTLNTSLSSMAPTRICFQLASTLRTSLRLLGLLVRRRHATLGSLLPPATG